MGRTYEAIDDGLAAFLIAQPVFFVATAPLAAEGLVNCSPKGLDTFRVLDPHAVAYLDLTGSGVETIAHLRENGRIVLMFCAFDGAPRIVRLHGRGTALFPGAAAFEALAPRFPTFASTRAIVRVDVARIADSCGYGVPRMPLAGPRAQLLDWAARKGDDGVRAYRAERNRASLDGLPGVPVDDAAAPTGEE